MSIRHAKQYRDTTVHWSKSQGLIISLLEKYGITESQFTNIGWQTAKDAGLEMEKDTMAIMLYFVKRIQMQGGVSGTLPVRVIIPSVPLKEKYRNQAYRIFWWYLKTKFEAIETGLVEFEQEFMPHISIGENGPTGNMWQAFKQKLLPGIMSGKGADIGLLGSGNNP